MEEKQAKFMKQLTAEFENAGLETKEVDGMGDWQIGKTFMSVVSVSKNDDAALVQVAFARFNDELYFVNLYYTIIEKAVNDTPELRAMLNDINTTCPLGSFGIYEKEIYHKYSLLVDNDTDVDALVYDAVRALSTANTVVAANYAKIADGFMSLPQGDWKI